MTIYLICMCLVSLGIGYILAFTEATLRIGKSLSDVDTPRGYQDAITPPQLPLFGFGFNIIFICGLIYGFWIFGWLAALGAIVASIFVGGLSKAIILPKSESEHFHKLIIHSLLNRYANYMRDGDTLRASAIGMLLEKLGMPVSDLSALLNKDGDV